MKKLTPQYFDRVDGGFFDTPEDALQAAQNGAVSNLQMELTHWKDSKRELKDFNDLDKEAILRDCRNMIKAIQSPESLVVEYRPA